MKIYSYWKVILWAIIVLILSSISGNKINEIPMSRIPHIDKVAHFTMYFVLTILLISSLYKQEKKIKYYKIASLLTAVIYGGLIEILQSSIFKNRSGDLYDFAFNVIGAIMGLILFSHIIKWNFIKKMI